ncbi:hypothetical protein GQ457_12G000030 [Hibiscus cannabinus]
MCYVTDGIKATEQARGQNQSKEKIKFDSGICILVRIVSEANKTNYLHSCVPIASQAASVLAASVHGACESRQASPGKRAVVEIKSTSEHHQARSGTSVSVILILMFIDIY